MLQTGLRVGEVASLRRRDIVLRERAGTVRVRNGKGLKEREVPLNATARRALRQLLEQEPAQSEAAVFRSGHGTTMPVRSIQNAVAALVRRAGQNQDNDWKRSYSKYCTPELERSLDYALELTALPFTAAMSVTSAIRAAALGVPSIRLKSSLNPSVCSTPRPIRGARRC